MEPSLNRLHIRQFRLIDAIARTGQLSLAAELLSITQPAASRTLAELERVVGEPLFARRPKGLVPTPLGEVFIRHTQSLISELDVTIRDVEGFRSGQTGLVRIGTVTGPAVGYVVPALQKLKAEAPLCEVSIDVAPSVELVDKLFQGHYDFIIARVPPDFDPRPLDIRRGRVEEIRLMTRTDHPIQASAPVTLDRLGALTWVIQRTGMPLRDAIEQAFVNRNLAVPRDTVDTASLLVMISYLKDTDSIAAMTTEVVDLLRDIALTGLRELPMTDSIVLSPYHLIRRRNRSLTPICERMLALVADELAI